MGQVLGFSHCKEFGSVSSTPDSTPPCTDGGNEESDFPELQTAREWSEEEDDIEEDEGGASSPSVWGTPRQNSFELTFSYIAFSDSEGGGISRRDSMGSGRRRGGGRSSRPLLSRTDTVEMLLPPDSPQGMEWDPHTFLPEEAQEERQRGEGQEEVEPRQPPSSLELTIQPPSHEPMVDPQDRDPGNDSNEQWESSVVQHQPHTDSHKVLLLTGSLVTKETTATLLAAVQQGGGIIDTTSSALSSSIGHNTQEEPDSKYWFSASNLSEDTIQWVQIAVMDLIYWRDTERTGMVFTGLVVSLLSLFQLSIITVVSTLSLAIMCFTIAVRSYYKVLHLLQWGDGVHPFQSYLDFDFSLSGEKAVHYTERTIILTVSAISELKQLLFVSNLIDSLKFWVLAYLLTYVGAIFNGLTLLIVGVISLFSLPLFYKQRQVQVDNFLTKVKAHINNFTDIFHRLFQGANPTPDPDPAPGGAKPKIK